jgi:hypothetical protein
MDLSKLPRLSETDRHAPAPEPPPEPARVLDYGHASAEPMGAQIWLSAILGVVFLMMGWNFARFLGAKMMGRAFDTGVTWTTGAKSGQPVDYFDLQGYTAYTDASLFLFGLALVMEAAVMAFARRNTRGARALVTLSFVLIAGMTLFNIIVAGMLLQSGVMPIFSVLAVAFGGFMSMSAWQQLTQMRLASRRA